MSVQDKEQLNYQDDLSDIRALIQGEKGGEFSVDDILSEYGMISKPENTGPDLPWPEAPRHPHPKGSMLVFPGKGVETDSPPPEDDSREEEYAEDGAWHLADGETQTDEDAFEDGDGTSLSPPPLTLSPQPKRTGKRNKAAENPLPVLEELVSQISTHNSSGPEGAGNTQPKHEQLLLGKSKGKTPDYPHGGQDRQQTEKKAPEKIARPKEAPSRDSQNPAQSPAPSDQGEGTKQKKQAKKKRSPENR